MTSNMKNSTANQSVTSRLSRKRTKLDSASTAKVGVKRKSPISLGKRDFAAAGTNHQSYLTFLLFFRM